MTSEFLYDLLETLKAGSLKYKVVDALHTAMQDWPSPVETVEEYFGEVRTLTGSEIINRAILERADKKLSLCADAWKMESLAGLIEVIELTNMDELTIGDLDRFLQKEE